VYLGVKVLLHVESLVEGFVANSALVGPDFVVDA
jgi:hypothetical protein